jgi:hypothetical protein
VLTLLPTFYVLGHHENKRREIHGKPLFKEPPVGNNPFESVTEKPAESVTDKKTELLKSCLFFCFSKTGLIKEVPPFYSIVKRLELWYIVVSKTITLSPTPVELHIILPFGLM